MKEELAENIWAEFGKPYNAQDVALALGVDQKTIRTYYGDLGGVKIGSRLLFFEKQIANFIRRKDGNVSNEARKESMARSDQAHDMRGKNTQTETILNAQGGSCLGNSNGYRAGTTVECRVDKYGLL